FFFSSRRRHTRFSRDWSSDVCSSDLTDEFRPVAHEEEGTDPDDDLLKQMLGGSGEGTGSDDDALLREMLGESAPEGEGAKPSDEIGRASCRERGEYSVISGVVTTNEY